MFDGSFDNLRRPFSLAAQAVCIVALILFSLSPRAARAAEREWSVLAQSRPVQSQSFGSLWAGTVGAAFERWIQNGVEQRRLWVARIASLELRVERDSSRSLASWSITVLVHGSGSEGSSAPGAGEHNCI